MKKLIIIQSIILNKYDKIRFLKNLTFNFKYTKITKKN